jgi:hypothetical protein
VTGHIDGVQPSSAGRVSRNRAVSPQFALNDRPMDRTVIRLAPWSRRAIAADWLLAPVVQLSSITRTCAPVTFPSMRNVWGAMLRLGASSVRIRRTKRCGRGQSTR